MSSQSNPPANSSGVAPVPTSTTYPYGAYTYPSQPGTPSGSYPYQYATYAGSQWQWFQYGGYIPQQGQPPTSSAARTTPAPVAAQPKAPTPAPQQPPRSATIPNYNPAYIRDAGGRTARRPNNLKGLFSKELKGLMYGFGDDKNPANDSVSVLEEILIEYITDVCQVATLNSKRSRITVDDLRMALSRPADAKKLARMEELLFMQEDIKRARAQFDDNEVNQGAF